MLKIQKVNKESAEKVYHIHHAAFLPLLQKYEDYDTSPAMDTLVDIRGKMECENTDSYLLLYNGIEAGWIRIIRLGANTYRLGTLAVLPQYQDKKIAQTAMKKIEHYYPCPAKWVLDTVLQEKRNVHLYEKLGYRIVGNPENVNERMDLINFEKEV